MIRQLFLLSVCMLTFTVFAIAQAKPFTIKGKMDGKNDGLIYLSYSDEQTSTRVFDSVIIEKGEFKFKGNLSGPAQALFMMDRKGRTYDKYLQVYIVPADMKLKVDYDKFSDGELKGSSVQDEADQLKKAKAALTAKMKPLQDAYTKANAVYTEAIKAKKDEATLAALKDAANTAKDAMDPLRNEMSKLDIAFMDKHPQSYVTASMLRYMVGRMSIKEADERYSKLSAEIKNTSLGKSIKQDIDELRDGSPGAKAFQFASTELRGGELKLTDFRGKYVLVDFWASWCVPCRKGNPHLLSLYAKYKDKGLEIIGVSDDDSNPEAWKKAVDQDKIGVWKHVLRGLKRVDGPEMFDRSASISDKYGISSLPTKILIDPNGIIIGRYGGGGENDAAMDKKLAEIFEGLTKN